MALTRAGIILAGGYSRRMGTDKALLRVPGAYHGQPLICGITQLVATRCERRFILARSDQSLPVLEEATILFDAHPGEGPLVALGAGLAYAHQYGPSQVFVCAVDMPWLCGDFIDWLYNQPDAPLIIPCTPTHRHYLAGLYHSDLAPAMIAATQAGQRALSDFIASVPATFVPVPRSLQTSLTNVNSPSDLSSTI